MRGNREEKNRNKSENFFIFYIFFILFYRKIKKEVLRIQKNNSPNSEKKISQIKRKSQRKLTANFS
jgi:predicted O-linked N-acetylglucosamine transferase (SPINDLY family)